MVHFFFFLVTVFPFLDLDLDLYFFLGGGVYGYRLNHQVRVV